MNLKNEQAEQQFAILEVISRQESVIEAINTEIQQNVPKKRREFEAFQHQSLIGIADLDSDAKRQLNEMTSILKNAKDTAKSLKRGTIPLPEYDVSLFKEINPTTSSLPEDRATNISKIYGYLSNEIYSGEYTIKSYNNTGLIIFIVILIEGILIFLAINYGMKNSKLNIIGISTVISSIIVITSEIKFYNSEFETSLHKRDGSILFLYKNMQQFLANDQILRERGVIEHTEKYQQNLAQLEQELAFTLQTEQDKLQAATQGLQNKSLEWSQKILKGQVDWSGLGTLFSSLPVTDSEDSKTNAKRAIAKKWFEEIQNDLKTEYQTGIPALLRAGVANANFQEHAFAFTAGLPLEQVKLVSYTAAGRAAAVAGVQNVVARALTSIPAGQLKLLLIDPVGLGQNAAMFMKLTEYDETLVSNRAWGEPQHIEAKLAELTEHMENVIQKYLRNEYASIQEYNAQAPVPEALRLLVVFDFPTNFSEGAARRLVSIAQNGARCGVYTLVLVDQDKPLPYGFTLNDLKQNAFILEQHGDSFSWQGLDPNIVQFSFDQPPAPDIMNALLDQIGKAAQNASRVEVPFEKIAKPASEWWRGSTGESVKAILGPSGARTLQELEFGKDGTTAHHGLIAGRTGSGKSTLLHALIMSLATEYSPSELELYLIDFKEGVEFKRYALHSLPHAIVVAIESEREFGISVLRNLDELFKKRSVQFKNLDAKNLIEAREKHGQPIPRVLLLVDEFQMFFQEDDRLSSEAMTLIDRIVRQGRSYGIHILFASQSLAGSASLPRPVMDQMGVRIALQCSDADSRIILADDNPQARLLSRPGEAIYNDKNGLIEGNNRFQVAFLNDEVQEQMLSQIAAGAKKAGWTRVPIVFEGNAPAVLEDKFPLSEQVMGAWQAPPKRILGFVGEPIAIKAPTALGFRRQSGSNALLMGQDEILTTAMLTTTLFSLAAQLSPKHANFWVLDFTPIEDDATSPLETLRDGLPHPFKLGKRRELPQFLEALSTELKTRMELENGVTGLPSHFLVIAGAARARDLRPDENAGYNIDESASETPAQQLSKLLREGPELGIHTLISCDTVANLNRTLERRSIGELDMRVVLQMSNEDSSTLIDTPAANKLGSNRALFYSVEEGKLEKFRPYRIPNSAWLTQIAGLLKNKQV